MSYQPLGAGDPVESICQYGASKLPFRGPLRALNVPYVACIGGDETFGRFVDQPFAAVLERKLNRRCINLGSLFCGAEALFGDSALLEMANAAELCVLQVPGVLGQSNRFYRVHPRRNDRFLHPTPKLKALYPEEDFTDVHFVRHLARRLKSHMDARFDTIADELCQSWQAKLRGFLDHVTTPVLLLWIDVGSDRGGLMGGSVCDPVPIKAPMLQALAPYCAGLVAIKAQVSGESEELEDMLFGTLQQPMAERMIGPATHRRIANSLALAIRDLE